MTHLGSSFRAAGIALIECQHDKYLYSVNIFNKSKCLNNKPNFYEEDKLINKGKPEASRE